MLLPGAWDFVLYWCEPPVETPSMKSPWLRTWYVPVKHVDTRRISSLSSGLVPFIVCVSFIVNLANDGHCQYWTVTLELHQSCQNSFIIARPHLRGIYNRCQPVDSSLFVLFNCDFDGMLGMFQEVFGAIA